MEKGSPKVKVTLSINREIWKQFQIQSIVKFSRIKYASSIVEQLMIRYLESKEEQTEIENKIKKR